jgi:hypothetical protein
MPSLMPRTEISTPASHVWESTKPVIYHVRAIDQFDVKARVDGAYLYWAVGPIDASICDSRRSTLILLRHVERPVSLGADVEDCACDIPSTRSSLAYLVCYQGGFTGLEKIAGRHFQVLRNLTAEKWTSASFIGSNVHLIPFSI